MSKLLLAMLVSCVGLGLVTTADARSSFDGAWALTFYTQRGACDATYNFLVNISNSIITSPAFPKFRGYVAGSGAVRILAQLFSFPFTFLYLLLYATAVHTRRALRRG